MQKCPIAQIANGKGKIAKLHQAKVNVTIEKLSVIKLN